MPFISKLNNALATFSRGLALAGLYVLFVAALLVGLDVVLRKVFGTAFIGSDELAGYALALATSWSLSYAFFEGSHIRVNVLQVNLSAPAKAWLDVLAVLATAIILSLLAWRLWGLALESLEFHAVSNTPLHIPLWIPQFLFFGGVALFLVSAVSVFLEGLGHTLIRDYKKTIDLIETEERSGEHTL